MAGARQRLRMRKSIQTSFAHHLPPKEDVPFASTVCGRFLFISKPELLIRKFLSKIGLIYTIYL